MAVAYKNEDFGSQELNMTVADPIVLSSALPRFMSPGDTVTMPVTISNTTASGAGADVKLSSAAPCIPSATRNNRSISLREQRRPRGIQARGVTHDRDRESHRRRQRQR